MNGSRPQAEVKSFYISKLMVWEAFQRVKANKGAPGADGVTIEQYEQNLSKNLFKLWNRMSSGSYFPPAVKAVEIPKAGGKGIRVLGVPTVDDRIAQTVAAMYLERRVEPVFHPDSYGYRPRRSALDAVEQCRKRCWRSDWVVDLDIRAFFDSVDHELMLRAVERHIDEDGKWVLLYVKRWLVAPLAKADGSVQQRDRGTPQGSAVSPVLANLYLHYAFDVWLAREFPKVTFERYCDDAVIHCGSEGQARRVRDALEQRLAQVGLELHPDKTRIVYCKDADRRGSYEHTAFTFLGYTFRPRLAKNRYGKHFVSFLPTVSKEAIKAMGKVMRSWHIAQRSDKSLMDLARMFNSIVQGWINYYGQFYKSMLYPLLRRINRMLVGWACQKYKRLRRREKRAGELLAGAARRYPNMFAHWRFGLKPDGWAMGAV
ncbi:group II intron reverse transcriptase/maturase [Streptomyces sp. NBC_00154]|uniref:group II intron reverse transcriptase/maturase n=1 Tax=Streptomyces sp. NBC_00154 TaxID=2975670 RepID=UPI002258AF26|nr:group II intron reverse transcriptase/maturase [Streptomyces sp. NBC_00154]MCX5309396.1 group II intron reverse transcriptase/maturase [Streptomyces sp. NBC_00154]